MGGKEFLAKKAAEPGVTKMPSGLLYKVIKSGTGTKSPKVDTPCLCHYTGTFIDGKKFDSSRDDGEPLEFAPNQVIAGWTEAMQMMHEGDQWELYLPCELGYGPAGDPPDIPPKSCLVFEMELVKI